MMQIVTSSNVLRKGSLQTKLNAGLSEQQQEDLFQNERTFHEVKLWTTRTWQTYTASANLDKHCFRHTWLNTANANSLRLWKTS